MEACAQQQGKHVRKVDWNSAKLLRTYIAAAETAKLDLGERQSPTTPQIWHMDPAMIPNPEMYTYTAPWHVKHRWMFSEGIYFTLFCMVRINQGSYFSILSSYLTAGFSIFKHNFFISFWKSRGPQLFPHYKSHRQIHWLTIRRGSLKLKEYCCFAHHNRLPSSCGLIHSFIKSQKSPFLLFLFEQLFSHDLRTSALLWLSSRNVRRFALAFL